MSSRDRRPTRVRQIRRFLALDLFVIAFGLVVAFLADRPTDTELIYADAWREIGGAIVAGGVVGGLVLWFEERREDERVGREEQRDERAALQAWRRDLDLRMLRLVLVDLTRDRAAWFMAWNWWTAADSEDKEHLAEVVEITKKLDATRGASLEVSSILELLGEDDLLSLVNAWDYRHLSGAVRPSELSEKDEAAEEIAWQRFRKAIDTYRLEHYPPREAASD